ncbi:bacterial non-heme ferritin [Thermaurantimonas aggregans]|uniref:Ferritin n=1 Tax=Thermaurantimonas aggregans TaxID=2173829 RepID=A0A401XKQ2_9FLAO|nr:ferritin [Thermaurantimonas aggregans]MCX8147944.1 ferritin [Thermaurantimonas aggregans]GCD77606.1 bacterial non-heme ferritin [Thermaurantimonas aggregans]
MIVESLEKLFNQQITVENAASTDYLKLAVWCASNGFDGASKFFFKQSDEERGHMLKLVHYLLEREGKVVIEPSKNQEQKIEGIFDVLQAFYHNELNVTKSVNALVSAATAAGDYGALQFLQWYVQEQHEEETQARSLIEKANLIGREGPYKYLIDQMLADAAAE